MEIIEDELGYIKARRACLERDIRDAEEEIEELNKREKELFGEI